MCAGGPGGFAHLYIAARRPLTWSWPRCFQLAGLPGASLRFHVALAALLCATPAAAAPTLDAYRHFRALSIDLNGRMPTREELAAFEQPGFDLAVWIETHTAGAPYVDRVTRIYMDLLRLQVGSSFQFVPA